MLGLSHKHPSRPRRSPACTHVWITLVDPTPATAATVHYRLSWAVSSSKGT